MLGDRSRTLALAAILVVAAGLRLTQTDLTLFSIDQARDAHVATGIVSGRSFPMVGVELGSAHTWGPLYFYMLAMPFALSHDPSLAVAMLGLITLASVWLIYRVGRTWFGAEAGLIAAALFATYPRVVLNEKSLSNVTPVPFFTLLFFQCLFAVVSGRRSVAIIPTLAALAVLVQLHLSTLTLGIVLGVALLVFRPRLRVVHVLIGLGIALAIVSPYVVAQAHRRGEGIRVLVFQSGDQIAFRSPWELVRLVDDVLRVFPDLVMSSLRDVEHSWVSLLALPLTRVETWIMVASVVYAGAVALGRLVRPGAVASTRAAYILVALWLAVPIATLGQRQFIVAHHFELLYPAICLATAAMIAAAVDALHYVIGPRGERYARVGVAGLVSMVVVTQISFHERVWSAVRAGGAMVWTLPDSGLVVELMPIRYKRDIVQSLVDDFGLDRLAFFRRVHGSRFQDLLDDKEYFWSAMERRAGHVDRVGPAATVHYRLARSRSSPTALTDPGVQVAVPGPSTVSVGPYTITAYIPRIDYAAWVCAHDATPGRSADATAGSAVWQGVDLLTARRPYPTVYAPAIVFRSWGALPVSCRGWLTHDSHDGGRRHVIVSIRTPEPSDARVAAFSVNGRDIAARRTSRHVAVAHTEDVRFNVSDALRLGRNELIVRIEGPGRRFDLDVYEGDESSERDD